MIEQDLVAHIVGLATAAGNRVHNGNAPQKTSFPVVVIRRIGGATPRTLGGVSLFARAQFSINVLTSDYVTAYPVANAINASLHGFVGQMGSGTTVQSARCVSFPSDQSEIDGDRVVRWVAQEFLFVYLS